MHKITPFFICQLIPTILFAQEYPSIDTVNYGSNVSHVYEYFHYDHAPEQQISSFWFNESGKHQFTLSGYGDKVQTKILYKYDESGILRGVNKLFNQSTFNDSISRAYENEIDYIYKNYDHDPYEDGTMDSLYLKYNSMYEYVNPEKASWQNVKQEPKFIFYRNSLNQDSIILVFSNFSSEESYLYEKVFYYYNDKGELITKKWDNIEHPNIIEFSAFKSGTVDFEDSIKLISGSNEAKTYDWQKKITKMKYYVNGKLTGYEHQILNNDGLVTEELVFNTTGDTLSHFMNTYNDSKLLESRYRKYHSGYNGFGYSLDFLHRDNDKYTYDSLNRLIKIDSYNAKKHISTRRFEIFQE
ncbi:MAG: hypothetical protein OCD76_06790 [Reichenbachiella sp.]